MRELKLLSALLCYPSEEMVAAADELRAALPERFAAQLLPLVDGLATRDLLDLQADYVEAFDRGRRLSLHLFEHVHGESRDRGQAMVDLAGIYQRAGLFLAPGELPDYLPSFLEYLSTLTEAEALANLAEIATILAALRDAAAARGVVYAPVFAVLSDLAGAGSVGTAAAECELSDLEQLDADWAEKEVRFGPGEVPQTCSAVCSHARPVAAPRAASRASA